MVGNILIDNLRFNHDRWQRPSLMDELGLTERKYIVFTLNRKALLADKTNLQRMVEAIVSQTEASGVPVVAVLRKDARDVVSQILSQRMDSAQTPLNSHLSTLHSPLPYLQFGYLTKNALGIITDSGNVAEEATFNGVPCITLNSYTEHIETVKVGTNVLVGEDAEKLQVTVADMVSGQWKKAALPDRWDGRTADRIIAALRA